MHLHHHWTNLPETSRRPVLALGNFDGVHRGHQEVIGRAREIARASGAPLAALTLEPHPRLFFKPDAEPFLLTSFRLKERLLEEQGVNDLFVLAFDEHFRGLSAADFIEFVLVQGLGVPHVVVGGDFAFGNDRHGGPALLQADGRFGVTIVPQLCDETGEVVSSTRIRQLLREGKPRDAARLLGRLHEVEGRIIHGHGQGRGGREVGFSTANFNLGVLHHPAQGVYAVYAGADRGLQTVWQKGVAFFGGRPTFGENDLLFEVHFFRPAGLLYGQHLRVRLVEYLRMPRQFSNIGELALQISLDVSHAGAVLEKFERDA